MDITTLALVVAGLLAVILLVVFLMPSQKQNDDSGNKTPDDGNDDDIEESGADPTDVDDDSYLNEDGVVMFGAPGCPGCRSFLPVFTASARTVAYPFRYFNITKMKDRGILRRHKITKIPHVVAVRGGKIVHVFDGPRSKKNLRRFARRMRALK